jgi:isoleucyl-tRNA synthetase
VHLALFPKSDASKIDTALEAQMEIAQNVSSLVLGLRKKEKLRVRQPLQKIMVPALNPEFVKNILHVKDLILSEVNVKELELLDEKNTVFVKSIKPNFKTLGKKYPQQMKDISAWVKELDQETIASIESNKGWKGVLAGNDLELDLEDFEILAQDIPGWLVAAENGLTVALDATLTDTLVQEGIARELVNRVQNLRKDSGLEVTDKISLTIACSDELKAAILNNQDYVCNEVLATGISFGKDASAIAIDLVEEGDAQLALSKVY